MRHMLTAIASSCAVATIGLGLASAAPANAAPTVQCGWAQLHQAGNGWYIPLPTVWEGNGSTNCNLKFGDDPFRGEFDSVGDPAGAIRSLQRNLNYCYHTNLAVDGIYGSFTRAAVARVQRLHKITVDGIYGPQTRSAMNWREYNPTLRRWSERCYSPI